MKRLFIICIFFVSCCMLSWADSPLTSTHFSDAYADEPMVVMAGEHGLGDRIPTELLSFLADKKAPVDVFPYTTLFRSKHLLMSVWLLLIVLLGLARPTISRSLKIISLNASKQRTGGNYRRNLMPALLPFMPMLWQCPTGPTFRKPAIWFIMR